MYEVFTLNPDPFWLAVLFGVGLIAGFIDAIAGGGGLLTIPVLLWSGMSPLQVLATNKLQAIFGSGSATWHFIRKGVLSVREIWPAFLLTLVGSVLGTQAVKRVDPGLLEDLVPWLLIGIAVWVALAPSPDSLDRKALLSRLTYAAVFGVGIGFYDGFFGPGTGTFFAMSLMMLRGYSLRGATIRAKSLNFASNLASLMTFAFSGYVVWQVGLLMALGQFTGARLGSGLVISQGTRVIRPLLVTVCILMAIKLLLMG
jgi:uncharacterized membrane protein YfcA